MKKLTQKEIEWLMMAVESRPMQDIEGAKLKGGLLTALADALDKMMPKEKKE